MLNLWISLTQQRYRYKSVCVCAHARVRACMRVSTCVYTYVCASVHKCVCIRVLYVCVCSLCTYMYVYVRMCPHAYTWYLHRNDRFINCMRLLLLCKKPGAILLVLVALLPYSTVQEILTSISPSSFAIMHTICI